MPDDKKKPNVGLVLILVGIGAGVIAGAAAGIFVATRKRGGDGSGRPDSVDGLRDKAERVLHELSDSINELREQTQRIATDPAVSNGGGTP